MEVETFFSQIAPSFSAQGKKKSQFGEQKAIITGHLWLITGTQQKFEGWILNSTLHVLFAYTKVLPRRL